MSWRTAWEWQTFQRVDPELVPHPPGVGPPVHEHQRRWLLPGKRQFDLALVGGERVRLRILGAEKGDLQLWRSRQYSFDEGVALTEDLVDLGVISAGRPGEFSGWAGVEDSLRDSHSRLKVISVECALTSWTVAGCELSQGRFVAGGHRSSVLVARSPSRDQLERLLNPRLRGLYSGCDSVRALLGLIERSSL